MVQKSGQPVEVGGFSDYLQGLTNPRWLPVFRVPLEIECRTPLKNPPLEWTSRTSGCALPKINDWNLRV